MSSIVLKLHRIMSEVPFLSKDKFNDQQKYKYVSEQQVKEVIQPLLVRERLLFLPVDQEIIQTDNVSDSKQRVTSVRITWEIHDLDTGEMKPICWIGSGADSMDKGVPKAITMAIKTWMTGAFLIPTGDDSENPGGGEKRAATPKPAASRGKQDPNSAITEGQQKRLFSIANAHGVTTSRVKEIVGAFGYESSKEIKVKDYDEIVKEIAPEAI